MRKVDVPFIYEKVCTYLLCTNLWPTTLQEENFSISNEMMSVEWGLGIWGNNNLKKVIWANFIGWFCFRHLLYVDSQSPSMLPLLGPHTAAFIWHFSPPIKKYFLFLLQRQKLSMVTRSACLRPWCSILRRRTWSNKYNNDQRPSPFTANSVRTTIPLSWRAQRPPRPSRPSRSRLRPCSELEGITKDWLN